uniref:HAT C-terminal dimerisation domain-containing protein n=1 Tax=Meloidogyne incognita TaxID=6306 RepID=A0A914M9A1_MELIC
MAIDPRFKRNERFINKLDWINLDEEVVEMAYKFSHFEGEINNEREIGVDSIPLITPEPELQQDIWFDNLSPTPQATHTLEHNSEKERFVEEFKIELVHFHQLPNIQYDATNKRINFDTDIFGWFRDRQTDFPKLTELSRLLFCIPCTSVSSERLFSKATCLYSNKQRTRLKGTKAENILLLKSSLQKLTFGLQMEEQSSSDEELIEEN